jgi:hypothetical protein
MDRASIKDSMWVFRRIRLCSMRRVFGRPKMPQASCSSCHAFSLMVSNITRMKNSGWPLAYALDSFRMQCGDGNGGPVLDIWDGDSLGTQPAGQNRTPSLPSSRVTSCPAEPQANSWHIQSLNDGKRRLTLALAINVAFWAYWCVFQ